MDYREFRLLLDRQGLAEKSAAASLVEVLHAFPYFQTAHLLLANEHSNEAHYLKHQIQFERVLFSAPRYFLKLCRCNRRSGDEDFRARKILL